MDTLPNPIPLHAQRLVYRFGRKNATIYWWRTQYPGDRTWYWSALGNSGWAATEKDAVAAAREYIQSGK